MFNSVSLIGNVGQDPETKCTVNGARVANFSLAVNEVRNRESAKTTRTHWFNVVAFEKTADLCARYLKKGNKVAIRGRLANRTWESDGQRHSLVEIIAREIEFLGNGQAHSSSADDNTPF